MSDATLVQVPLWGGLDESVDDARVPQNRMRQATNCVFPSSGVTAKRNGFTAISSVLNTLDGATTITGMKRLIGHKSQVLETDYQYLYGYTPATTKQARIGRIPTVTGSRQEFTASTANVGDIADNGNYRALVWSVLTGVGAGNYVTIIDKTNGARVVPELQLQTLAGAGSTRVIAIGVYLVVLCNNGVNISARAFNTSTLAWVSALTSLGITDVGGLAGWDATPIVGLLLFTVGWGETTVKKVQVQTFDPATLASFAGPVVVETALPAASTVTVRSTFNETLWVGHSYSNGGTTFYRIANHNPLTLAQTLAPYTWTSNASNEPATQGIERVSATLAFVVGSVGSAGLEWRLLDSTTGPTALNFGPCKDWLLMSKPFIGPTGLLYALVIYAGQYQGTQVLVELAQTQTVAADHHTPLLPMATIAPRASLAAIQGAIAIPGNINIARSSNISTGPGNTTPTTMSCVCFAISPVGVTALQVATFDFNHPSLGQHVSIGDSTYVAAGVPYSIDGVRPVENGFLHAPKLSTFAVTPGGGKLWGGGGVATIIYKYVAIFSQENVAGEYMRSPPTTYAPALADTSALAASATHTATIRIQTLKATFRQHTTVTTANPVTIEVYRTHWDGAAMSTIYYRVGSFPNDLTVDYIDFVDDGTAFNGASEVTVTTKPVLYTTGDVLESDCPPSLRFLCVHLNRIFGIGDDGRSIWYTTPYVAGEQPRWNDYLRIYVPDGGGDLTALASLDGRLYAFKRDRAYIIAGDGPSDTGAGADFTLPQLLPFGVGCIDARTIAVVPDGILTDTEKGLYLFGRDGTARWVGDRTERTRGAQIVTSITHLETDGCAVIALKDAEADASEGQFLYWDYRQDCWSRWQVTAASYGSNLSGSRSAVVVNGVYYSLFVGAAGASTVAYYNPATWLDDGSTWITMVVQSAWITTADLQGFQRVARIQLLATRQTSHALTMIAQYDWAFNSTTFSFPAATLDAVTGREILQVAPAQQKCAAMSVLTFDGVGTGGNGEGTRLQGMLFKVRGKRGEFKTLASAQKG